MIKFTTEQGLSSYNIHKIIKDQNGYVWIATQYGLSRFDGRQFVNYSKSASPGYKLGGVDIRDLALDSNKSLLWVFPGELSFNSIDLNTLRINRTFSIFHKNAEEFVMSSVMDDNSLWVGSSTGLRFFHRLGDTLTEDRYIQDHINGNHDLEAQCVFKDHYNNLWCFYNGYGVGIYNPKTKEKLKQYPLHVFNDYLKTGKILFNGCIATESNKVLIATSQGLREIIYDSLYNLTINDYPCRILPSINSDQIEAIFQKKNGSILVATHSAFFSFNHSLDSYAILQEAEVSIDGDWLNSVQSIYCDNNENIWLGCQQGLAFIHGTDNPFQSYFFDKTSNLKLDHVRSIYKGQDGDLLIGLRNGIAKIESKTKKYTITDQTHLYHHIYQDNSGKIIVSRTDGQFIYSDQTLERIEKCYPEFRNYCKNPINSHLFIGDSIVILGTENDKGILIWNNKRHTVRRLDNSSGVPLASDVVNNIYKDKLDRIWVLSDHVATIISDNFKKTTALSIYDNISNKEISLLFDMCEADGSYWLAAYGTGIIELDEHLKTKKIFNTESGLSDNGVYQIFPVNNKLVITSDKGLSVFDINGQTFQRYYQQDGLHSNSFEEVAGTMKDGLIYAGGIKGFTIIDPSKFTTNTTPPKVYINRIFIDRANQSKDIDTTNLELKELDVPEDVLQTTLYFSGINYSNPDRTTFAYRIVEHNKDWVNIGTQNYINLIGLAPGKYHVEVRAANEDGVWSQPIVLMLRYQPKWYQTWWFGTLLALVVAMMGYGFYRMRIDQLLRQQKIRKDVASDLHDDIGSSLNSVKVFTHLAMSDDNPKEQIKHVEENLKQATAGLRDMIWVLDDKRDTVDDLRDRLRQFSAKPAEAMGIAVHFDIQDSVLQLNLPKPVKRNLLLVAKEAINNSVKYAACANIWVTMHIVAKKITLVIKDDGKGFDMQQTSEGYGLGNIRERARQINFECSIKSGHGGTEIMLTGRKMKYDG